MKDLKRTYNLILGSYIISFVLTIFTTTFYIKNISEYIIWVKRVISTNGDFFYLLGIFITVFIVFIATLIILLFMEIYRYTIKVIRYSVHYVDKPNNDYDESGCFDNSFKENLDINKVKLIFDRDNISESEMLKKRFIKDKVINEEFEWFAHKFKKNIFYLIYVWILMTFMFMLRVIEVFTY